MFFKEYLSVDDVIAYAHTETGYTIKFEDLQALEREGKIKPVVYLKNTYFDIDFKVKDLDIAEKYVASAYYEPNDFILLDKIVYNPYREHSDTYFGIDSWSEFKLIKMVERSSNSPDIDTVGLLNTYHQSSEGVGEINSLDEIAYSALFFRRTEIERVFNIENKKRESEDIQQLKQQVKELERQLEIAKSSTPAIGEIVSFSITEDEFEKVSKAAQDKDVSIDELASDLTMNVINEIKPLLLACSLEDNSDIAQTRRQLLDYLKENADAVEVFYLLAKAKFVPLETITNSVLDIILDETHEYHAPDLKHAINLWTELYIKGAIKTDSHSHKANLWIKNNTGYANDPKNTSVARIRETATPLKDFGGTRPKEIQK